jgi:hypothetical protein
MRRHGHVLKRVEIEVAAILARSEDGVGFQGGRRHGKDWQEQGANRGKQRYLPLREFFREALWDAV